MKYARIQDHAQVKVVAVSDDERRYTAQIDDGSELSGDMQAWIRKTAGGPAKSIADGQADWKPLDGVRVLAPVAPARNIFCVGKNYRQHAREFPPYDMDTTHKERKHAPPVPGIYT